MGQTPMLYQKLIFLNDLKINKCLEDLVAFTIVFLIFDAVEYSTIKKFAFLCSMSLYKSFLCNFT